MLLELVALALGFSPPAIEEAPPPPVVESAKAPEREARADNDWWIPH